MSPEKREFIYSKKPLSQFSAVNPYFQLLIKPLSFFTAWNFIFTVIKDFFWIQQKQALKITKRRVIKVDTDLDDKIPFTPERVTDYIGFVSFFVKPMDMLIKRLGYIKAVKYVKPNVQLLIRMYKQASTIYKYSFTTTTRPDYKENATFKTIHAADPHLLCVPSLHVSIAAGTYAWYKKLFEKNILPEEEQKMRLAEIKKNAIAIIESVLFVKQHSVNCIPIAFYMLTSVFDKDFFPICDAINFLQELFVTAPELSEETRKEVIEYFCYMYDRILLEGNFCNRWQEPIEHWLEDFAVQTGQK